jgi:hypothetical protein
MAQRVRPQGQSYYGTPAPLGGADLVKFVSARRDPTTADVGYDPGTIWLSSSTNNFFGLSTNAGGVATWTVLGSVSSVFTTLTATTGNITTVNATTDNAVTFATTTAATKSTWTQSTITATGSNAAIDFTIAPKGTGAFNVLTGDMIAANGNITANTAGTGLKVKEGANARMGNSTLNNGTIAVANTSITATTRVFLTRSDLNGGVAGMLEAVNNAGVGFTINSYDAAGLLITDQSKVNWMLVEPA